MNQTHSLGVDQSFVKAQSAARCAARKLKRLGYSNREALDLMQNVLSENQPAKRTKISGLNYHERIA
jgi:hypothetical protein